MKGKDKHLLMKHTQNSHGKTTSYFFILLSKATPSDLACELQTEDLANNYISIQNCEFCLIPFSLFP